jgi:hypothetical protein
MVSTLTTPLVNPLKKHILVAVLILAAVIYGAHAIERHGVYAQQIRQCLEQKPPDLVMHNPFTGRDALCVKLSDGKWGVQVIEKMGDVCKEVTCFPNKSNTVEKLIRYLFHSGYVE